MNRDVAALCVPLCPHHRNGLGLLLPHRPMTAMDWVCIFAFMASLMGVMLLLMEDDE